MNSNGETNTETLFYISNFVLFKLSSFFRNRKFRSLHKFLCPTVSVKNTFCFTTYFLLILESLGCNIRSGTAKQMVGSVQMLDLLHYDT